MKVYIFILVAFLFSCKSNKVDNSISEVDMLTLNSALGEKWEVERSSKNTYLLAIEKKDADPKQPIMEKQYVVLDESGDTVYSGKVTGGYVKWFSDTELEYYNYVGIMPKDAEKSDFVYIYNIEEETTVKKSEMNN
ncbi:MAG: hypothetical protein AB8B73_12375 [Ekhidna sp.]